MMKQKVLNSSLMQFGGFVNLFCRLWLSREGLVRLPQNKIGTYNKANKAYMAFEQEHEREPSTEELADILEMSETEINNIFQSNTRHTSLDAPVHEAEDVAMGDLLKVVMILMMM